MPTLTERHRALNIAAANNDHTWTVASNGAGKRHWFVLKRDASPREYHNDKNGDLVWYTEAGAITKAEQLNAAETR